MPTSPPPHELEAASLLRKAGALPCVKSPSGPCCPPPGSDMSKHCTSGPCLYEWANSDPLLVRHQTLSFPVLLWLLANASCPGLLKCSLPELNHAYPSGLELLPKLPQPCGLRELPQFLTVPIWTDCGALTNPRCLSPTATVIMKGFGFPLFRQPVGIKEPLRAIQSDPTVARSVSAGHRD